MEFDVLRFIAVLMFIFSTSVFATDSVESKPAEPSIRVGCRGQLRHGVVAIGGETTGTTITFESMTWELKLSDDSSRDFVREHHKKPIVAIGSLRRVTGAEIPVGWVIDVERISADSRETSKLEAAIVVLGKLQAEDIGGRTEDCYPTPSGSPRIPW